MVQSPKPFCHRRELVLNKHRVPPNVKFEIDDVESSWVNNKKYDFIFVRHMLVSIADWPKLVKNVYE